jgi:hypothetical protein
MRSMSAFACGSGVRLQPLDHMRAIELRTLWARLFPDFGREKQNRIARLRVNEGSIGRAGWETGAVLAEAVAAEPDSGLSPTLTRPCVSRPPEGSMTENA